MTAFDLGDMPALTAGLAPFPAVAGWDDPPQIPTGPWSPRTDPDPDLPVAVDPALAGWQPPTIDDLGLTADPVAIALNVLGQLTDEQLAAVLGYYQPPKLRAVA